MREGDELSSSSMLHYKKGLFSLPQPEIIPGQESLVSDIPVGKGKTDNLFLQCRLMSRFQSSLCQLMHTPCRLTVIHRCSVAVPLYLLYALQRNLNLYFPKKGIARLSPTFHSHVSESDLYIPAFDPPISCSSRQIDQRNL